MLIPQTFPCRLGPCTQACSLSPDTFLACFGAFKKFKYRILAIFCWLFELSVFFLVLMIQIMLSPELATDY